MQDKNKSIYVWVFVALIFAASLAMQYASVKTAPIPASAIGLFLGVLGFIFWRVVYKKPIIEIYSQTYPYRRLKPWGVVSAFVLFEYVLARGLYSGNLKLDNEHFYYIIAIFIGTIAFYFSFIRMKISLKYLFYGIFIPLLAFGAAMGFGKYFEFINFSVLNIFYWVLFNILYQLVCEEPVFRGIIVKKLSLKGEKQAILISSVIFAMWHVIFMPVEGIDFLKIVFNLGENFIVGCLLAVLFLKGKNLLIPAISHGIINGLKFGIFSGEGSYGFTMLWLACLSVGTILLVTIPEKKRPSR